MNDELYYLCHTLSQVSSLTIPIPTDTFIVQTDTSTKGIAGVLNVVREGEELPEGLYSRKLHLAEARYSATVIECLAIVRSIQHFGVYLVGKLFTLQTDHKALTHPNSSIHLNGRLTRWALLLQPYNFTTRYRPGQENCNAKDPLVRLGMETKTKKKNGNNLFKEGVMSGLSPDWLQSSPQRRNIIYIIRSQTINTHRRKSEHP